MNLYPPSRSARRGFFEIDLAVALAILTLAIVPLAYSFASERRALHVEYCRAAAIEIVDGEMEILAAGAANNLPEGVQDYPVHAAAAAQLPAGHFQLTKTGKHLRLEWTPGVRRGYGPVVRETDLK